MELACLTNDLGQAMLVTSGAWPTPLPVALMAAVLDDAVLIQAADGQVLGAARAEAAGHLVRAGRVSLGTVSPQGLEEAGEVALSWRMRAGTVEEAGHGI